MQEEFRVERKDFLDSTGSKNQDERNQCIVWDDQRGTGLVISDDAITPDDGDSYFINKNGDYTGSLMYAFPEDMDPDDYALFEFANRHCRVGLVRNAAKKAFPSDTYTVNVTQMLRTKLSEDGKEMVREVILDWYEISVKRNWNVQEMHRGDNSDLLCKCVDLKAINYMRMEINIPFYDYDDCTYYYDYYCEVSEIRIRPDVMGDGLNILVHLKNHNPDKINL